jgi:hypothetical protein
MGLFGLDWSTKSGKQCQYPKFDLPYFSPNFNAFLGNAHL